MDNRFLADYLIKNFWDQDKKFDNATYGSDTTLEINQIQEKISELNAQLGSADEYIKNIHQQIIDKNNQILTLKNFIEQKSGVESLKTNIDKLSLRLGEMQQEVIDLDKNILEKQKEQERLLSSLQKYENRIVDLKESLSEGFANKVDTYLHYKKSQIGCILAAKNFRKEDFTSVFGREFESATKDQYPFEDFKDLPDVLQELTSTFETEKTSYVTFKLDTHALNYTQNIIDAFNQMATNYYDFAAESQKNDAPYDQSNHLVSSVESTINYKDIDAIYKNQVSHNETIFPYLKNIEELLRHPLFKKKWEVSYHDIKTHSLWIRKKSEVKKQKDLGIISTKIILDYNIPLWKISPKLEKMMSQTERTEVLKDSDLTDRYAEDIYIDKESLVWLHKMISLFNEKKLVSFKWFEHIIGGISKLLKKMLAFQKDSPSLYTALNSFSQEDFDSLNDIVESLLNLLDNHNMSKDLPQQLIIFQNILSTIFTSIETHYFSQNIDISHELNSLLIYMVQQMSLETLEKDIIDDVAQKNALLSLYENVILMIRNNMSESPADEKLKERYMSNKSSSKCRIDRVCMLYSLARILSHFIVSKNIYDITTTMFAKNTFERWDRKACADLYTTSPDFKVPSLDPIIISEDKFGIKSSEYMFESYDLSKTPNYLAYVRMFNISDFKHYEKLKKKHLVNMSEKEKSEKIIDMMVSKDEDIMTTTILQPEFTPLFVHKNFEISIDGVSSAWLIYIIGEKHYEMLRAYVFYNFMESNRDHNIIITTPSDLIRPVTSSTKPDPNTLHIITINPDMTRTITVPKHTGKTKEFEYKKETIVMLNPKSTTWLFGFEEAKQRWKELYVYAHNIHDEPNRKNSVEKVLLSDCETYEEFLAKLWDFRKKYQTNPDIVVRVDTYRSEFEKYEWAKEKTAYRIANTKNSPKKIMKKDTTLPE